jgi:S-adenosylmethionine-diacylglycerol 3-amino-3-carboxypropyl transferase
VLPLRKYQQKDKPALMKSVIQKKFYNYLFNNKIVYNVCMEDPHTDIRLFQPTSGSNIFVLASGGCNALHYALDANVDSVHCIDANPCQIALVNMKKQVFQQGDYEDLWKMFGDGIHEDVHLSYEQKLRPGLPDRCVEYWDKNLKNFKVRGSNRGFQYHTGCGLITRCFALLKEPHLAQIARLFELNDKKQQIEVYEQYLEPIFKTVLCKMLINVTTRFGIPSRQISMISNNPTEVLEFLNARIKRALTELPANENYFYHLYIFGRYRRDCAPEYLNENNFELLQQAHHKVDVKNAYVADYLAGTKQRFSHFALLDHLDWLVHDPELLEKQWRAILSRAETGAKLLIRTYFSGMEWLPAFVEKHVDVINDIDEHVATDRIGIYNKTHLLQVRTPLAS